MEDLSRSCARARRERWETGHPVAPPGTSEGAVATLNFERFFDTSDDAGTSDAVLTAAAYQGRLTKASKVIRDVMQSPDIIACVEVEKLSVLQDIASQVNADSAPSSPAYHGLPG